MKPTAPKNNVEEDKPDMSLIPLDVLAELLVPTMQVGVKKYWRDSWRDGLRTSELHASLLRHLKAFIYDLEDLDPDALKKQGIQAHHLGAVAFAAIAMYNTVKTRPELDDRRRVQE